MEKRLIAVAMLAASAASAAPRAHPPTAHPPTAPLPTAPGATALSPDADPPIGYAARKGDNLYNLALHYMHRLSDYHIVQRRNHIRDPYRIPIGTNILIPRSLLRSDPLEAKVIAFRGTATIDGKAAIMGATVNEGGHIQTGQNAFLSIGLADGSTITLPSQTRVQVERLRRFRLTNELERLFRVDDGRTQTEVTPRTNGRDRFEMRTPISVAAVRGTDFRVAVLDGGKAATSEVLGGHVELAGGGAQTLLDPGEGVRVSADGTTGPIKLLPPPDLADPTQIQSEPELAFAIAPLDQAKQYRVQVAKDAGFLDLVEEVVVDRPQATLPSLPDGDWFVRITGIDANAIEGLPHVISFERFLLGIRATAEAVNGRTYLFKWQDFGQGPHRYRFFLARDDAPDRPVIDEPGLTAQSFVATDLPTGDYVWRVQISGASHNRIHTSWSTQQTLTIAVVSNAPRKRAKPPAS